MNMRSRWVVEWVVVSHKMGEGKREGLLRGWAVKGRRTWRVEAVVIILWKNLENVGRSGTERS